MEDAGIFHKTFKKKELRTYNHIKIPEFLNQYSVNRKIDRKILVERMKNLRLRKEYAKVTKINYDYCINFDDNQGGIDLVTIYIKDKFEDNNTLKEIARFFNNYVILKLKKETGKYSYEKCYCGCDCNKKTYTISARGKDVIFDFSGENIEKIRMNIVKSINNYGGKNIHEEIT